MLLFKAAGGTYARVIRRQVHAFPFSPREVGEGEFVLLSKNREDCTLTEPQIQHVAKLLEVRPATPAEIDALFPGVRAGERWKYLVELYWTRRLDRPFNLSQVAGINHRRYDTVQLFARIDTEHEMPLFEFLCASNPNVVVDVLNNAVPPGADV